MTFEIYSHAQNRGIARYICQKVVNCSLPVHSEIIWKSWKYAGYVHIFCHRVFKCLAEHMVKHGGRVLLKSIKSDVFLKRRAVLYRKFTYNSTRRTPINRTNIIVWDMAGGRFCFPLLDQKVSSSVCRLPSILCRRIGSKMCRKLCLVILMYTFWLVKHGVLISVGIK